MRRFTSITRKQEFENVFRKGALIKGSFIFFKIIKTNQSHLRTGVVVGKKISKKAVVRNKVKRQIKEIIKKEATNNVVGMDIIIMPSPGIVGKTFTEIKKELKSLFKKAIYTKK